jgi:extracellular factor (EF) 3-hydroxypalmitic acid methyl ester biosynthesis protein
MSVQSSAIEVATREGERLQGDVVRLGRFEVVLRMAIASAMLRASEILPEVKITIGERAIYSGRATIHSLVDEGGTVTCELVLEEPGVTLDATFSQNGLSFESFQKTWLAAYRILPEMKIVVSDVGILLSNCRDWLNGLELILQPPKEGGQRNARAQEFLLSLAPRVISSFNGQHERFEEVAYRVEPELRSVHHDFVFRAWREFFLSTPFGDRTFRKPLGYAGDYEMMNMIHRNAPEGRSLFAEAMHLLLVSQWPAQSVRNRIAQIKTTLVDEAARVVRSGRRIRVLNVGCGPAREVQDFLQESLLSDHADFTFLDFNEETLQYVRQAFEEVRRLHGRRATAHVLQMSVHQLLRNAMRKGAQAPEQSFDFVYCAGLFDYLSNATCKALVELFYRWLTPGGLVAVANMHDSKPFRNFIEFILDWHLIYRDARTMWTFCPGHALSQARIIAEPTTVNLFLYVRRPEAS